MSTALEKLHELRQQNAQIVFAALSTPAGQDLLKLLEDTFFTGALMGRDPHETYYRIGQRDLVDTLRKAMEDTRDVGSKY